MKLLWFALLFAAMNVRAETLAIIGAEVWTNASDAPIKDATIVIAEGRIVSITSGAPPPANARVLKAAGEVVTPPLDAAATQIALVEVASASDTDDRAVSSGPLGAAFDVSLGVDGNELSVQQARAAGVAHAMVFPSPASNGIFAGRGARLDLSRHADIVERARAAMFVTAGGAAGKAAGGSRAAMWGLLRTSLDEARRLHGPTNPFYPPVQLQYHPDIDALMSVLERCLTLPVCANTDS